MTAIPQELLDLLNEARAQLDEANDAVLFHAVKEQETAESIDLEEEAKEFAFEQLQESNASAGIALDELRKYFGI